LGGVGGRVLCNARGMMVFDLKVTRVQANSVSRKEMEALQKLRSVKGASPNFHYRFCVLFSFRSFPLYPIVSPPFTTAFAYYFPPHAPSGKLDFSSNELTSIPMEAYAVDETNIITDLALQVVGVGGVMFVMFVMGLGL